MVNCTPGQLEWLGLELRRFEPISGRQPLRSCASVAISVTLGTVMDTTKQNEPVAFNYYEYAPHPRLASQVQCYWSMRTEKSRHGRITSRGLSKGYVDLIFATGGAFCEGAEQWLGETKDVRCYVVGPMPEAALAHSTAGLSAVGIRLRPGYAHSLLRTSCGELARGPVSARDIWPEMSTSFLEQVADADHALVRLGLLERILLERVVCKKTDPRDVRPALEIINATGGKTSIDRLMAAMGIGARQLERKFHEQVGLAPKRLCQIARIQHAIRLARSQTEPKWTDIVFESGFYDQAHFIRHFKSVTGLSPKSYMLEATLKLSER